jgi:TRAP transporter T-component
MARIGWRIANVFDKTPCAFGNVRRMRAAATTIAIVLLMGCNMVKFTTNTTAKVLKVASFGLGQESDVELARQAAPASLKTVEGFLLASPDNKNLTYILARGYCEYAFGFLDDDVERLNFAGKTDEADAVSKRATRLFLRCMNYGLKLLDKSWEKAIYADMATFEAKLKNADEDDVPGLFFVAQGLGSAINQNKDDIEMVAYAPKVQLIFERVVALDEKFNNATAHVGLGLLHAARGEALGGKPEESRKHFQRAIELTGGKFLMPKVMMAYHLGVIKQDREFFHRTLVEVLSTSPAGNPDLRLANELAHQRARRYLAYEKELF